MITTFAIFGALLLLMEEVYNWRGSFNSFLNLFYVWILTVMGMLVTFKMLLVLLAIKAILRDINEKVNFMATGVKSLIQLADLVDVHMRHCVSLSVKQIAFSNQC